MGNEDKDLINLSVNDSDNEIYESSSEGDLAIEDLPHERFIDELLDLKVFIKDPSIIDEFLVSNIRLFRVFGIDGDKVIFTTIDDLVYAFGCNDNGSLGLGIDQTYVKSPTISTCLSGKGMVDFAAGWQHCIGLTKSGHCYGWGLNKYGEVGIGHCEKITIPTLIDSLKELRIVGIRCGAHHSMALTSNGQLFVWGHNMSQNLDLRFASTSSPTRVLIDETIASIDCGMNHSLALTDNGSVFMWGDNSRGQLGHSPDIELKKVNKVVGLTPTSVWMDEPVKRAVCGSNHTLVLTIGGNLYAFGDNRFGQVGNGTTGDQHIPTRINNTLKSPKIKDIVAYHSNDVSIAVSVEDKIYYWGCTQNQCFLRPKKADNRFQSSLFNIYAILAKTKVTFKTVNIDEDFDRFLIRGKVFDPFVSIESPVVVRADQTPDSGAQVTDHHQESEDHEEPLLNGSLTIDEQNDEPIRPLSSMASLESLQSIATEMLITRLKDSFDNPEASDLRFVFEDKQIYCHKTVLKIRNKKFWQKISQEMVDEVKEIYQIRGYSWEAFCAFLQYMYGIDPEINITFVNDLRKMAKLFGEPELEERCHRQIQSIYGTINASNVCQMYEKATKEGVSDIRLICVDFAANHWLDVCKSDTFLSMSGSASNQLLLSIFSRSKMNSLSN